MSIFSYLQKFNISVGKIPLLTEEEIKDLGKRLKAEQKINSEVDQNEMNL